MLLAINPENPQLRHLERVRATLESGGVIAYPTDTTYGIGCSIFNKRGIEKIYQLKRREKKKPFSFICADLADVAKYAQVSNFAFKTMKRLLPGPFTFVMDARSNVPDLLLTRQKTVGIRIPDNRICLEIVRHLSHPIVTTSANRSGEDPIGDPRLIVEEMGCDLDIIIDGGILPADVSSVVSLIGDRPELLRAGVGDVSWCG